MSARLTILQKLRRSGFLQGVTVLMGGTMLVQLVPLLALPVLSRLYSPETFAMLALVMMAASLTAPLSTGYYEQAIAHPRQPGRARMLASIAIWLAASSTLLVVAVLSFTWPLIMRYLTPTASPIWLVALPFALLGGSLGNIANYWLLRAGRHARQSSIRLVHALCNAGLAIALGLAHLPYGLLYAFMLAVSLAACWGMASAYRHGFRLQRLHGRRYALPAMHHYREFPLFGSIPATFNNLALQLPLIAITANYTLAQTGHFSVTRNLLSGSIILASACIGQVLMKHLAARMHRREMLWPFFSKVLLGVGMLGALGGVAIYALGPWFFRLYLGAGWEDSGRILQQLAVSMPFMLLGASLAPALVVTRRLKIMARWQVFYAALSAGLFLCGGLLFGRFIWCVVGMECLAYGLYIPLIAWQIRRFDQASLLSR